jgi:hypothetical protein
MNAVTLAKVAVITLPVFYEKKVVGVHFIGILERQRPCCPNQIRNQPISSGICEILPIDALS